MTENQTTDIQQTLQQQTELLQHIATTQQEILAVEKSRLGTERWQMYSGWIKMGVIVLITWISFVAAKQMMSSLTSNMGGLLGGGSPVQVNGAQDLAKQLQGSQELIRELLGN